MRRRFSWFIGLALLLGACSGGSSGPSVTAMGTVQNQPVPTTDVIGTSATSQSTGSNRSAVTTLGVVFANQSGLCGEDADPMPDHLAALRIRVSVPSATVSAGTYAITDSADSVGADFITTDANGNTVGAVDLATMGSVTFTKIDSGALDGTFDFTFGDGHVSGSFHAPICSG